MRRRSRQIIAVLMVGLLLAVSYSLFKPGVAAEANAIEINMSLVVGEHIGFNVSNESLVFGMVPRNGTSTRFVNVTNNRDSQCMVNVEVSGDLMEWIHTNDTLTLDDFENKELKVDARVPSDAEFGEHSGMLRLTFKC